MREFRREIGLTQASFGEKIGYAAGSIRNMEAGQQKISNRVTLAVKNLRHKFVG
jgi:DNA-binding XRE family transcriptional regulator